MTPQEAVLNQPVPPTAADSDAQPRICPLSDTALSNMFTMTIAAEKDPRQQIPEAPAIPDEAVRRLRARLIFEEALETINALGFTVELPNKAATRAVAVTVDTVNFANDLEPDLEKIVDGCVDTHYVCVGTLLACGIPDVPHTREVNQANFEKFPGGVAITCPTSGKFQKPEGWKPPNHQQYLENKSVNIRKLAEAMVDLVRKEGVKNLAELTLTPKDEGRTPVPLSEVVDADTVIAIDRQSLPVDVPARIATALATLSADNTDRFVALRMTEPVEVLCTHADTDGLFAKVSNIVTGGAS